MVIAPAGITDYGAHMYHLATGALDHDVRDCEPQCLYADPWLARGDTIGITATGRHAVAEDARASRADVVVAQPDESDGLLSRIRHLFRCDQGSS
jgi:hypothetical protein